MVRGDLYKGGEKGVWGHDVGRSFTPGCVEVKMFFLDEEVVRVEMLYPYDKSEKGNYIDQKGMSEAQWTAAVPLKKRES